MEYSQKSKKIRKKEHAPNPAGWQKPNKSKMIDMILTLLAVLFMAFYYNGTRALFLALYSLVFAIVLEFVAQKFFGQKRWHENDLSAPITGLIVALLLPATAPYWLACFAGAVAIVVAKFPFGGYGHNIFNPAAVGLAFVALSWPQYVLSYPQPFSNLSMASDVTANIVTAPSPAFTLLAGGVPRIPYLEGLMGSFAGPMGATSILVIAMCGLYLVVRKTISWVIPFFGMSSVLLIAALLPRVGTNRLDSIVFETISGVLVFGLVFMATDPTTSPKSRSGGVLFGLSLGALTMFFRFFGKMELSFLFALLIMNALSGFCDRVGVKLYGGAKEKVGRIYHFCFEKGNEFLKGKFGEKYETLLAPKSKSSSKKGGNKNEKY